MRRIYPIAILLLVAVFFSTTGFQCGSAELTSAKLYINQKQYDKAEASLIKEVEKNDKNEEAWFLLGQVRMEMKRYNEMLDAYKKALEVSDVHKAEISGNRLAIWAMMYNEGVKNYNVGKDSAAAYDKALEQFSTAIAMEPDSAGTYYVAAMAHFAKKDYQKQLRDAPDGSGEDSPTSAMRRSSWDRWNTSSPVNARRPTMKPEPRNILPPR